MSVYRCKFSHSKIMCALMLSVAPIISVAAEDLDPNAVLIAEKDRLKAETDLITAKTALETARLNALNLPKIENKTDLSGTNAGQIEATMLASRAVEAAAIAISSEVKVIATCADTRLLVLTGTEKVDLNLPVIVKMQINAVQSQLNDVTDAPLAMSAGAIFGIINAAAGLFGNDTKVTAIDLTSVDAVMLAQAVAGKLASESCKSVSTPSGGYGVADLSDFNPNGIPMLMNSLFNSRKLAVQKKIDFGSNPSDPEKKEIVAIDAAVKAYDDFIKLVMTPDANGNTALTTAIALDKFSPNKTKLVRVWVNKAGGSLINTKNIATMFGLDPVKVSGGLVVSYSVVNAQTGTIEGGGMKTCQTSLASLRKIQSGKWAVKTKVGSGTMGEAFCR